MRNSSYKVLLSPGLPAALVGMPNASVCATASPNLFRAFKRSPKTRLLPECRSLKNSAMKKGSPMGCLFSLKAKMLYAHLEIDVTHHFC